LSILVFPEIMKNRTNLWQVFESNLHDWWFLSLLLLPQILPPYSSHGYALQEWGAVNEYIITHSIKGFSSGFLPVFRIIPLVMLITAFAEGRKISRLFSFYIGLSNVFFAFLQSISISETWGMAICTANLVTFLLLAVLWFIETAHPKNLIEIRKHNALKFWPLMLALIAFWEPVNPHTLLSDFDPVHLLTSGAGLSFCMATPLYLAVLILSFPQVNKTLLACTGFIGFYIGISNLLLEFVIIPEYWWIGVLHFPLVILSLYGLYLVLYGKYRGLSFHSLPIT
jgi:hypothetical protein